MNGSTTADQQAAEPQSQANTNAAVQQQLKQYEATISSLRSDVANLTVQVAQMAKDRKPDTTQKRKRQTLASIHTGSSSDIDQQRRHSLHDHKAGVTTDGAEIATVAVERAGDSSVVGNASSTLASSVSRSQPADVTSRAVLSQSLPQSQGGDNTHGGQLSRDQARHSFFGTSFADAPYRYL